MFTIDSRRTRTALWLGAAVICLGILGGVGSVEAKKVPKVEICHFDAETGEYNKLSVSGNAVQKHIDNHGDIFPGEDNGTITLDEDCNIVEPTLVFARAYIDANRSNSFDPDDIVIAELVDADNSMMLGPGDEVVLGQYPLTLDPCPEPDRDCTEIGNYESTVTHLVTSAVNNPSLAIIVNTQDNTFTWEIQNDTVEQFIIDDGTVCGGFIDTLTGTPGLQADSVLVTTGLPAPLDCPEVGPSDDASEIDFSIGHPDVDNYFINFEFPADP